MSEDVEEEAEGDTTLYFDAETGTLRDEDGDEVTFDVGSSVDASEDQEEDDEEENDEEEDDEGAEGSQTPHATASTAAIQPPQQARQTITSTSFSTPSSPEATRPAGRLRRLSSATQSRVSSSIPSCSTADSLLLSLRHSNPAADSSTPKSSWYTHHVHP